ncbi:hypothetical protein Cfla_3255 [Cellulomonas flavigena DSM 20109]|uniref:Uncharacterized protein n=2 Tax=Cellulomonas flavigena TaxID=1711 RepID=D5UBX7_CELFN|nr:hypothetical protein Cfla_3255 [Cellulomonas flavigena DSM 20109]
MMGAPLIAPDDHALALLGLDADPGDKPWVRSVTLTAVDHATVTVTWDVVAASVHVLWVQHDVVRAELSRESVDVVALDARGDGYAATITSRGEGLTGILTITATSAGVRLRDSVLRT